MRPSASALPVCALCTRAQGDICHLSTWVRYSVTGVGAAEKIEVADAALGLLVKKDNPFEVYIGNGKTMPIGDYLHAHPHPNYADVERRLEELAVGTYGERAGDILLIAHDGDRDRPEERYYFAEKYRSRHGSPSKQDFEIPLIVAHHHRSSASIATWVKRILGDGPYQRKLTDIMLELRKQP